MGISAVMILFSEQKSPMYHANPETNAPASIFHLDNGRSRIKRHYLGNCIWFCTNFVSMLVIETILIYLVVFTCPCKNQKCCVYTFTVGLQIF